MTTDSTPSTTSLKDKRLYEYTNEDIYALLEGKARKLHNNEPRENSNDVIENPPYWSYHLTNKVFYMILSGGSEGISEPSDLNLPLKSYKSFSLELWDYVEKSEEMKAVEGPTDQNFVIPGLGDFWIKINYHVWPHKQVDPRNDERFKQFEWANEFDRGAMTYSAWLPASTIFDIIRYCDKISGMKAFW